MSLENRAKRYKLRGGKINYCRVRTSNGHGHRSLNHKSSISLPIKGGKGVRFDLKLTFGRIVLYASAFSTSPVLDSTKHVLTRRGFYSFSRFILRIIGGSNAPSGGEMESIQYRFLTSRDKRACIPGAVLETGLRRATRAFGESIARVKLTVGKRTARFRLVKSCPFLARCHAHPSPFAHTGIYLTRLRRLFLRASERTSERALSLIAPAKHNKSRINRAYIEQKRD